MGSVSFGNIYVTKSRLCQLNADEKFFQMKTWQIFTGLQ